MKKALTHAFALKLAVATLIIGFGTRVEAQDAGQTLTETRETVARWVETQQLISKESRDWDLAKQVLRDRIALVNGEISTLNERVEQTRTSLSEVDGKRVEMISEDRALLSAGNLAKDRIGRLEADTLQLLRQLPAPLLERVEILSQRIPEDPSKTTLSVSERYQNVIGVLNEVNKFAQDTTVVSEIRDLESGVKAEVEVLYLGLGQAYYVSADGTQAGVGRPTMGGWTWRADDEIGSEVRRAIAVFRNEETPGYVALPVEIER